MNAPAHGHSGGVADEDTVILHLQFEDGHEWQNEGAETAAIAIDKTPAWTFFVPKAGATGGTLVAADIGVDVPNEPYAAAYRGNVTRATDKWAERCWRRRKAWSGPSGVTTRWR